MCKEHSLSMGQEGQQAFWLQSVFFQLSKRKCAHYYYYVFIFYQKIGATIRIENAI